MKEPGMGHGVQLVLDAEKEMLVKWNEGMRWRKFVKIKTNK